MDSVKDYCLTRIEFGPTIVGVRRTARGYSLIELLTVLAIIAIITGFAVPQFTAVAASSSISANSNSLTASFDLARSEAISRNAMVTVCRATGIRSAVPACTTAGIGNIDAADWASGWIVYVKPEGTVAPSNFDASVDILLKRIEPESIWPAGPRSSLIAAPATAMVAWGGNGLKISAPDTPATIFTLDYRDPSSSSPSVRARCLLLSVVGRARAGRLNSGVCDAV